MAKKELRETVARLLPKCKTVEQQTILKKALSLGIPRYYIKDLEHDLQSLNEKGKYDIEIYWLPRETGTSMILTSFDKNFPHNPKKEEAVSFSMTLAKRSPTQKIYKIKGTRAYEISRNKFLNELSRPGVKIYNIA